MQDLVVFPSVLHDGCFGKPCYLFSDVKFNQSVKSFLIVFYIFKFFLIEPVDVFNVTHPVINKTD